jgi:hypothetical protein
MNHSAFQIQSKSSDQQQAIKQPVIFDLITKDQSDIIGLLAYAFHELSHREWHKGFIAHFSREPNLDEATAFMIGEGTEHRIEAYRKMAEDALNKREQDNFLCISKPKSTEQQEIPAISNEAKTAFSANVIQESNLAKGMRAALRLPPDTNLKVLGKSLVLLFVLVSLLAVIVNYAKRSFF